MTAQKTVTRRDFNKGTAATLLAAAVPMGCASGEADPSYEALTASTWRHSNGRIERGLPLLKELVRYATLAANSHNTQPWQFRLGTNRIDVLPDFSRRCPAVDPDDHHLFATLGCATENLIIAAEANGLVANVSIESSADTIRIELEPGPESNSPLFQAIPERQCTRAKYDGKRVSAEQLALLESTAQRNGTSARVFTDNRDLEIILEYVVAGNSAQMNDQAFVTELKDWIRFSESTVTQFRDGLFSASSGNPTVPNWLGKLAFKFAFTEDGENDKYRDHIRSSAGVIAFVSEKDNKESWINAGRCYQRFALQATALGLRHAFVNQAVEVPQVRKQFADYLDIGSGRPDLLVRFGYGPELPRSVRRPVEQVILRS